MTNRVLKADYTHTANEVIFIGDIVELIDTSMFPGEQWPYARFTVIDRYYQGQPRRVPTRYDYLPPPSSDASARLNSAIDVEPEVPAVPNGWVLQIEMFDYARVTLTLRRELVRLVRRGGGTVETPPRDSVYPVYIPSGVQPRPYDNSTVSVLCATALSPSVVSLVGTQVSNSVREQIESKQPGGDHDQRDAEIDVEVDGTNFIGPYAHLPSRTAVGNTAATALINYPWVHERSFGDDYRELQRGANQLTNRDGTRYTWSDDLSTRRMRRRRASPSARNTADDSVV